jgi:hypothetical protein
VSVDSPTGRRMVFTIRGYLAGRTRERAMNDPGCDQRGASEADRCGRRPTRTLAIGVRAAAAGSPGESGLVTELIYEHYCEQHLPLMQRQLGRV